MTGRGGLSSSTSIWPAIAAGIASNTRAQSFFPFAESILPYPTESSLLSCPAAITEIMRAMPAEQALIPLRRAVESREDQLSRINSHRALCTCANVSSEVTGVLASRAGFCITRRYVSLVAWSIIHGDRVRTLASLL